MKTTPILLPRAWRRGLLAAVLALVAGAAACDDPFQLTASRQNIDETFEVWGITGSSSVYPAGIIVPQATAVRLDAAGSFDLAFDIDGDGRLMVYPVGSVVSPLTGARLVEFQRITSTYSEAVEAPKTGWTSDSLLLVNPGQAFFVKVRTLYCQYDLRQEVYAKFYVDSVIPAEHRIKLGARINPNCGFRSLLSGVPEF
ncbi:MAG: hypothetical protein K1X31_11345 [Gemmatimonadaceae bacterium]|nr:hypothetical protein [Gemmatimonadaceae bacterium]